MWATTTWQSYNQGRWTQTLPPFKFRVKSSLNLNRIWVWSVFVCVSSVELQIWTAFHPLVIKNNCECELELFDSRHMADEAPGEQRPKCMSSEQEHSLYSMILFTLLIYWLKAMNRHPCQSQAFPAVLCFCSSNAISYPLPLIPDALIVFDTAISTYLSADYDFDCAGWWQHLASGSLKKKLLMEISSRRWCAPGGFQFCPCACDRYICN